MKKAFQKHAIKASLVFMVCILVLLSSCSNPTATAEKAVKQLIKEESNGYLEFVSFKKLDGIERKSQGTEMYEILYEAEVKVVKDGGWLNLEDNEHLSKGPTGFQPSSSFSVFSEQCGIEGMERRCKKNQVQKGKKYRVQNIMFLEKRDNGWVCLRNMY